MRVAFLFPGQGSQYPGMLRALPDRPAISATLAEASAILGHDVHELETASTLQSTMAVQLAIVVAGVAAARALEAEHAPPDAVAGLSVGAFSAAVACGSLDFAAALPLVRLRGKLMERAYPSGYGLASIIGLDERQVTAIVAKVATAEHPLYLSNLNAPRQIVIAGTNAALDAAIEEARLAGARKAKRLAVSVPSHCPLLSHVATELGKELAAICLREPRIPYVSNRGGRVVRDVESIRQDLATNVAWPVRWHDATMVLVELGIRLFIEMPPGQVLTDLAKAAFPETRAIALDATDLQTTIVLAQRERGMPEAE